jgi:hypothetical protein
LTSILKKTNLTIFQIGFNKKEKKAVKNALIKTNDLRMAKSTSMAALLIVLLKLEIKLGVLKTLLRV